MNLHRAILRRAVDTVRKRPTTNANDADGDGYDDNTGLLTSADDQTVTSETIKAVHQPLTETEMMAMPEGKRDASTWNLWTLDEIKTTDIYIIEGVDHTVLSAVPRREGGFWRAVIGDSDNGA